MRAKTTFSQVQMVFYSLQFTASHQSNAATAKWDYGVHECIRYTHTPCHATLHCRKRVYIIIYGLCDRSTGRRKRVLFSCFAIALGVNLDFPSIHFCCAVGFTSERALFTLSSESNLFFSNCTLHVRHRRVSSLTSLFSTSAIQNPFPLDSK